jgi:hypothetical protein
MNAHVGMDGGARMSRAGLKAESAAVGMMPAVQAESPTQTAAGNGLSLQSVDYDPFKNGAGNSVPGNANRITNPESQRVFWNHIERPAQPGLEGDLIKNAAGGLPPVIRSTAEHAAMKLADQTRELAKLTNQNMGGGKTGMEKFHVQAVGLS